MPSKADDGSNILASVIFTTDKNVINKQQFIFIEDNLKVFIFILLLNLIN